MVDGFAGSRSAKKAKQERVELRFVINHPYPLSLPLSLPARLLSDRKHLDAGVRVLAVDGVDFSSLFLNQNFAKSLTLMEKNGAEDQESGSIGRLKFEDFDSIIDAENTHHSKGYETGRQVSERKQTLEGFLLGIQQGFESGSEVGIYKGFASVWIPLLDSTKPLSAKQAKARKILDKIAQVQVQTGNPDAEDDPAQVMQDLRAKFKLCKVLLDLESSEEHKTLDW